MAEMPLGTPFKKGISGNPGGRSTAMRLRHRELARYISEGTQDGKLIVDVLIGIVTNPLSEPRDRMAAGGMLLDRCHGKTVLPIDLRVDSEAPPEIAIDWSAVPLDKRIKLLAALDEIDSLARLTNGSGDESTEPSEH